MPDNGRLIGENNTLQVKRVNYEFDELAQSLLQQQGLISGNTNLRNEVFKVVPHWCYVTTHSSRVIITTRDTNEDRV